MEHIIDRNKFVPISLLCSEYNKSGRGVSENTIRNYLKTYPEMFNIIRDGQILVELIPALEAIKSIRSTVSSGRKGSGYVLSEDDWDKIYEAIAEAAEACVEARLKKMKGGVKDECG